MEEPRPNETTNEINNPLVTVLIICHYEDIIKIQNKKAIGYNGKKDIFLKSSEILVRNLYVNLYFFVSVCMIRILHNTV